MSTVVLRNRTSHHERRQAALLRAKIEVGLVLRDMLGFAEANAYLRREGVPADIALLSLAPDATPAAN